MFDLGLSRATVKFVASHLSADKVHRVPELVWTSLALLVALGIVGGGFSAAFVPLAVTRFVKMPASFVGDAKTSLFLLCASMPIVLGNDALRGVLEATQRFDLVNVVKVPGSICFYLFAALAIPFGVKVPGIVLILISVRLVTACVYLAMCCRAIPNLIKNLTFSREAVGSLASFGGWIMVSNITGPILGNIERFLIASALSVGALAYYSAPCDLVGKLIIFPASIAPTLFPYFSSYNGRGKSDVSDVSSRSIKYLLLVMTPLTALFVCFARDILQFWLGSQFATRSTEVMQLISVMFFLNAFAYIPYTSVQALGRPDLKAMLDIFSLPIYGLSCWWLLGHMGINGAALARLLITVLDTAALYFFASRMKAFSFRDCVSGSLSRAFLASGGLLFIVFLIQSFHRPLIPSLITSAACIICYVGIFWALADPAEKSAIRRLYGILFRVQPTPEIEVGMRPTDTMVAP